MPVRLPAVFVVVSLLLAPLPAPAQAGIGPVIGTEYGFGVLAQAGPLEVGAGFTPVFVFVQAVGGGSSIFRVYFPGTVGAKASFPVRREEQGSQVNVEAGVTYSNLLRLGFGGGVSARLGRSRLVASAGVMIYPDAKDRLRRRINADEGLNLSDSEFQAPLTFWQPYLSVAILFGR